MAKKNLKDPQMVQEQNLQEAASKTEEFIAQYGKLISWIVIGILIIGLAIVAYTKFYLQPKKAEAAEQMFHAEQSFVLGDFELALKGNDNYPGFEEIAEEYGNKAGKAIWLYTGICELQTGNYEEAVSYLKKYKTSDNILQARAQGAIAGALVELEKYDEALAMYKKAAATAGNMTAAGYLFQGGIVAEKLGKKDEALSLYKEIKDKYYQSPEAMDIDKYISSLENAE